jgi:hypothetical protein
VRRLKDNPSPKRNQPEGVEVFVLNRQSPLGCPFDENKIEPQRLKSCYSLWLWAIIIQREDKSSSFSSPLAERFTPPEPDKVLKALERIQKALKKGKEVHLYTNEENTEFSFALAIIDYLEVLGEK